MDSLGIIKLTDAEFKRFAELIYDRTGIYLEERKLSLLSNRLRKRLKALKLKTFAEYYDHVDRLSATDDEMSEFLSVVTTNETYFFRNDKLWETFKSELIPGFVRLKESKARSLRIWSAAASSGEEAYTAAISLLENLPDSDNWDIRIVGSDISQAVLNKAKAAVYNDYAVSKMSSGRIARWFDVQGEAFHLKPEVKKLVRFQFHNLRDKFPAGKFDLIFLRNVLMYFDTPMKLRVLEVVTAALAPGGFLIIGDVDPVSSTADLRDAMSLEKARPGMYQKPLNVGSGSTAKPLVTT
ncbi:MAG: CheR family methyltransferase [Phycisphaerae bacterium]